MAWRTALFLLPSPDLAAFRELLVDVLFGLVDVVLHVSDTCIPSLFFGGCISSCVTASFPSSRPGTASFRVLPFDATGKSLPRCRLALAQEAVRGSFSTSPFSPWHSRISVPCFCRVHNTQLLIVSVDKPMLNVIEFRRFTRCFL